MLVIRNGTVVSPLAEFEADVLIDGEKIAAVGKNLSAAGAEEIDAEGLYVLPGGIDVHTHMEMPFGGTVSADDFESGTVAAVMGGVTTIIDFAIQQKGQSLAATIAAHRAKADPKVVTDYGIHLAITDLTPEVLAEIPAVIAEGYPTFKLFMTYPAFVVDDYTLFRVLAMAKEHGGMVSVHAENISMVTKGVEAMLAQGKTAPEHHAESRPDYVEAEAVARAIMWAEETGGPLYVVHLSSKKGLELIQAAAARGVDVTAETCPQYLALTDSSYKEPDFQGAKYVMSPPLRKREDNDALWTGLADGSVSVVASDHCPFTMEQKKMGLSDFSKIPNGAPGVETILPILYSDGVARGRISLGKLVEVFSYGPAKVFGLGSKGAVEPGKDADLVLFDPKARRTLSAKTLHTKSDNSPFEGKEVAGAPRMTISRGRIVAAGGKFIGEKGYGKFVGRKLAR